MNETDPQPAKPLHFAVLLLISFVLFNLGPIISQTFRWSDPALGFENGIAHVMVFGVVWCFSLLPWTLLTFVAARWRKRMRGRTFWTLAPAVLVLVGSIASLIVSPTTPSNRFKSFAKTHLPGNAQNFHCRLTGGGFADYADTYYFQTTPEEINRLIADMNLSRDRSFGWEGNFYTPVSPIPDCPDFSTWDRAEQYKHFDEERGWFFHLITDASKTQAYIEICCI